MKLTKKMLTGLASVCVVLFGLIVWVVSGSFTAEDSGGGGSGEAPVVYPYVIPWETEVAPPYDRQERAEADLATAASTAKLTVMLTAMPMEKETPAPTTRPTMRPTVLPTEKATSAPTVKPTARPTEKPETERREYVLNANPSRMRFHKPSCRSVKDIKDENRRDFTGTRDEVIGMGYVPCGNCKP
ncbi:MAG: hypothetical protein IJE08_00765 [Clostridia bacterium]|nr:hypothetical protein [Clostridia bacterium]